MYIKSIQVKLVFNRTSTLLNHTKVPTTMMLVPRHQGSKLCIHGCTPGLCGLEYPVSPPSIHPCPQYSGATYYYTVCPHVVQHYYTARPRVVQV